MKVKILILENDAKLSTTLQSYCASRSEGLFEIIRARHDAEAKAKAKLEKPDFIFVVDEGEGHTASVQALTDELSRHYLTQDIPIIHWQASSQPFGQRVSDQEDAALGSQIRHFRAVYEEDMADTNVEISTSSPAEEAKAILQLICEEFQEKRKALRSKPDTPPPAE